MAEINHRYLKDNQGETYYPITHIDAVQGYDASDNQVDLTEINNKVDQLNKNFAELTGDTGWIDYQVAPTYKKNQGVADGFVCGIREIRVGTIRIKSIRLNFGNAVNNAQIAQLPTGFITKTQTVVARSNSADNAVQISIRTDGSLWAYVNRADQSSSSERWVYYEHTWLE